MKIVYISHPISGDVRANLSRLRQIIRHINKKYPDVLPFAHYFVDLHALDDSIPEERAKGIKNDEALLRAGFINEMWLYGDRISAGMQHEINIANELGIPIIAKSTGTQGASTCVPCKHGSEHLCFKVR